jgi:hypothetical protein
MVNLIESWQEFEDYAGDKLGFYQLLGTDKAKELRVFSGRVGIKKEFSTPDDPLLARMINFCKARGYIRIIETVRDESFFR